MSNPGARPQAEGEEEATEGRRLRDDKVAAGRTPGKTGRREQQEEWKEQRVVETRRVLFGCVWVDYLSQMILRASAGGHPLMAVTAQ